MHFDEFSRPVESNTVLNPKLWAHDSLKPEVRGRLLHIAEDFYNFIGLEFTVVDIVITGSNVNYNYTGKSDLDLHIIANTDSTECDRELEELFEAKRKLYNEKYDINIEGIPVELYVEQEGEPHVSAGIYSILTDEWLATPRKDIPDWDEAKVKEMTRTWRKIIQAAVKTGDLRVLKTTFNLLKQYRHQGLHRDPMGEFSTANLTFKALRNEDVITAMLKIMDRLHSQDLSTREFQEK